MNKKDAVRMRPGTVILHHRTSRVDDYPMAGVVIRVTPKGGILIQPHAYRHPHVSLGGTMWVPYHHVSQVHHVGKDDFSEVVEDLNNGGMI